MTVVATQSDSSQLLRAGISRRWQNDIAMLSDARSKVVKRQARRSIGASQPSGSFRAAVGRPNLRERGSPGDGGASPSPMAVSKSPRTQVEKTVSAAAVSAR